VVPDGSRIYYDRWKDQPKGVFSVPALGGDEQLVLEDAISPEVLPDGSLMLSKINAEHRLQCFTIGPTQGSHRPTLSNKPVSIPVFGRLRRPSDPFAGRQNGPWSAGRNPSSGRRFGLWRYSSASEEREGQFGLFDSALTPTRMVNMP